MNGWNFTVSTPSKPGTLAIFGEAFGKASINIEAVSAIEQDSKSYFYFTVSDNVAARHVVEQLGWTIVSEQEVVLESIENRPGMLGKYTRWLSDAGINLTYVYLASDSRLVLAADDMDALRSTMKNAMVSSRA